MTVLFANRGNEDNLETFIRNYPEISFDFIKPYSYWARIENVRRYKDTISFNTWDNNGVSVRLLTPHNSVWIIKEPVDMSEKKTVTVDAGDYESMLADMVEKAFAENDAEVFDEAVNRAAEYYFENPERRDEGMPDTVDGIKVALLTTVVHGFFESFREVEASRTKRPQYRKFSR